MSEIDDLADISEQCSFGTTGLGRKSFKKPHQARCGDPEHMKGKNIRIYRCGMKMRTACRLCDKVRAELRTQGGYSAENYPL